MKSFTKTTAIILTAMMYMTTNAQSIIVKAGYNLSSLSLGEFKEEMNYSYTDEYGSYESKVNNKMLGGYHVAALIDFQFTEKFSLETGLGFSTRGTQLEFYEKDVETNPFTGETSIDESSYTMTTKLNYLELPVAAKLRLPVSSNLRVYVQGGIYTGFGISGKFIDGEDDTEENIDWDDDFNRFDVGASIGTGVEIGALLLGASYDFGLISLDQAFNVFQNRNLKFSVGYTIASIR